MTDTPTIERPAEMPQDPDLDRVTEPDTTLTVVQALNRVMLDVTVVRKQREQASSGGRFMFRGIDDVMNAVGPAFRKHGVICLPRVLDVGIEHATTSKGSAMTVTRVQVEYTFYGPAGDSITCRTPGEAFDSGDKSTAKAMSVAYRTALLQALTLPTDEPDPDETVEELAPRQQQQADRQQLPASRPAQRARGQEAQQADPWRKHLTPDERKALKDLMGVTDRDRLLAAFHEAERVQAEMPDLRVRPGEDLTKDEAWLLEIEAPTPLPQVIKKIGVHLIEVGSSVRDAIAAAAKSTGGAGK